jgi:hypothetical protein
MSLREELLSFIHLHRRSLVIEATDIAYEAAAGTMLTDRASVEQMLHGIVAIIEESLRDDGDEVRSMFLQTALPQVVASKQASWEEILQNGLPCWGVLVARIANGISSKRQAAATGVLAVVMGAWWREVSNTMLPLYRALGAA